MVHHSLFLALKEGLMMLEEGENLPQFEPRNQSVASIYGSFHATQLRIWKV
jgi:hypothetical protein